MERNTFGHAVVIGGSMAGLLAARVLADYFTTVTVIERDEPSERPEPRRGVPQGRHAHGLLLRGQNTICRLFPNVREELLAAGATDVNMGRDVKWYHFGVWKCRYHSALDFIAASRPLIEWTIAEQVRRLANVKLMHGWAVDHLIYDGQGVSGVRMHRRDDRETDQRLHADLVIDASGRGSQIPQQLRALGFERPEESAVRIDVGYSTCVFRAPAAARDWKMLYVVSAPPARRGGLILPMEGNRWMCTLVGMHGDHPPTDLAGYMAFARSLQVPDLYEALRTGEPLIEPVRYGFQASLRRHYEKLKRFPSGLLVLGDALCSFNPVYGQGMSAASMYADALQACLQERVASGRSLRDLWRTFFREAARAADRPWQLATGEDFRHPLTTGARARSLRFLHWYTRKVHAAAGVSPQVTERFYEVMHLLKAPTAMFTPSIMWKLATRRRPRSVAPRRSDFEAFADER
ncbi:MAG TPA: FAD-dependent monooxygenase [Steroidobacteraceae bacterium]|jgi:2-polyprenyl-6-methoxyphenol hydroxylase-like FAD-dependent oxidoreductase